MRSLILAAAVFAATTAAAPGAGTAADGAPHGKYRCESNGQHRMMMDFQVTAPGRYIDSGGKKGTYALDPKSSKARFRGGVLNGLDVDFVPGAPARFDVNSRYGSEAVTCVHAPAN